MKTKKESPALALDMWRHGGLVVACLVIAASLVGCSKEAPEEQPEVVRPIKMVTLGASGATGQLEYPGTIKAVQETQMAFEVPGRIVEFPVIEGQDVKKGALLARVDPEDLQAGRDADRASQRAAKAEYERYQDLYANNAVSLQELEVRQRQFEVSNAALKRSEKALRDTRLVAPFAGRVARKLAENFENVQAKQAVLLLQDMSGLEIVVNVPERDAASARAAMASGRSSDVKPRVGLSSMPGRYFDATLKEFATSADPVTRTFKVTFAFAGDGDANILPGMTARLTIDIGGSAEAIASNTFSVPSAAVVADDKGSFVWIIDSGAMTASRRTVEVGELSGSNVVILSGLSSGETIAVSGAQHLRDGMQVRELGN